LLIGSVYVRSKEIGNLRENDAQSADLARFCQLLHLGSNLPDTKIVRLVCMIGAWKCNVPSGTDHALQL